ncbi:hypothetical protein RP20_CCG000364 [Aedes albopictus]|nr:hypothetical protein RP20_CCG000364 [Aedes albopictus]
MNQKAKTIQNVKSAKTVRNVLVQPFKTVWPSVDTEEATNLIKMINELPCAHVVHGTNPVSHLLSQGQACALLITSDFHPQILGKQILQMARRNSPQILILAPEGLRWKDKPEKLIGIRETARNQSETTELLKFMVGVVKAKEYDKEHVDATRSKKDHPTERNPGNAACPRFLQRYLNRPVENKRAFVPPVSLFATKQLACSTKDNDWGEYISFKRARPDPEATKSPKPKKKSKHMAKKAERKLSESYIPLTVNRVQGNPDRKVDKKKKS